MEMLVELLGIATLGLLFWVRTGKLEAQVAHIADALSTQAGSLSGDAVLERFEALETKMGTIKAEIHDARTDADFAKRGIQKLTQRQHREEQDLIGKVTESILPAIAQQLTAMQQQPPAPDNGATGPAFLVR